MHTTRSPQTCKHCLSEICTSTEECSSTWRVAQRNTSFQGCIDDFIYFVAYEVTKLHAMSVFILPAVLTRRTFWLFIHDVKRLTFIPKNFSGEMIFFSPSGRKRLLFCTFDDASRNSNYQCMVFVILLIPGRQQWKPVLWDSKLTSAPFFYSILFEILW